MWFWNKKNTIATSGILSGATDHHSHILPGVDDGVETMEEALRILATYETLGIKELWFTPHIMEDIPNTPKKLTARFNELKAAYTGNITLHLAAEYMIDNNLHKLIQKTDSPSLLRGAVRNNSTACDDGYFSTPKECPIGATKGEGVETNNLLYSSEGAVRNNSTACDDGCFSIPKESPLGLTQGEGVFFLPIGKKHDHLLVETSYFTPPMRLHETLRKIKSLGYHPILAHPERYMYMEKEEYLELHEEGIKFQLNLASLAGGYGKAVKKKAEWLLKKGLYSVAGSDLHCEDAIEFITGCRLGEKEIKQVEQLLHN